MGKKRKRSKKTKSVPPPSDQIDHVVRHPVISLFYPQIWSLRDYILRRLPASSRSRRSRIASLSSGNSNSSRSGDFLDSTLVGVLEEPSPAVSRSRHVQFVAFSQSQQQQRLSLDDSDIGPACAQSEVSKGHIDLPCIAPNPVCVLLYY